MSATTQTTVPSTEANAKPLEGEALHDALKKQLEYYFSKENLMTDKYLLSQMNAEMYVPIKTIENFKMVKTLTEDAELIVKTLRELPSVVVDENGSMVKPNIKAHRNTIILRDIPSSTPVEEIKKLFENDSCGKVVEIKSEIGDNWYIQLDDDDSSLPTLEYIRNQKFNDKPVQARIKTENTFRSLYASAITSAAQTGQNVQVSYGYKPVQPQDVNAQQYENDNNYGRGNYNNRGGYRKRGGYNNRGNNRGGYKGHNNNNRENNQNAQNTNNGQTRKRRDSGKELKLSSDHFPPLPSQDKKVSGYTEEFRKYSRQEIVDVLTSIKEVQKPIISDIGITLEQPLLTLEASKPWPVVKKETKEETETTKDESSSQTVESSKIATTDNQTQAVETKSS